MTPVEAGMSSTICLTPDEVAALRQVLAMLATIGERGFEDDERLCKITAQMWYDQLVRPAEALMRALPQRRIADPSR